MITTPNCPKSSATEPGAAFTACRGASRMGPPWGGGAEVGIADALVPWTRRRRAPAPERDVDPSACPARNGGPLAGPAVCRRPIARRAAQVVHPARPGPRVGDALQRLGHDRHLESR